MDPLQGIVNSYTTTTNGTTVQGSMSQAYNASQGNYNVVMTLVTFMFLCGSLRTNIPFVLVFFALVFLFAFFAAGFYQLGYNPTTDGLNHAAYYFKIAGGFGFIALVMGWYLAIITACAATGVPCPLPIFDLSQKVFPNTENSRRAEHAGAGTTVDNSKA